MGIFSFLSLGASPNDGSGDGLREGGAKLNENIAKTANLEEDNTFLAKLSVLGDDTKSVMQKIQALTQGVYALVIGNTAFSAVTDDGLSFWVTDLGDAQINVNGGGGVSISIALTEQFTIDSSGNIISMPTYNTTTANAANVYVGADGKLLRSTSSEKSKTSIKNIDPKYSSNIFEVAKKATIFYKSKSDKDNPKHTFYGISAEKLAEIEPRLVFWGYNQDDFYIKETVIGAKKKDPKTGKLMSGRVEKKSILKNDAKLSPQGVQYDRFVPLMLIEMNKQEERICELEKRLTAIEAK